MKACHIQGYAAFFGLLLVLLIILLTTTGCMSNTTRATVTINPPGKAVPAATAGAGGLLSCKPANTAKNKSAETGLQQADSATAGQSIVINIGVQSKPVDVSTGNPAVKAAANVSGNALGDSALKILPGAAGAAIGAGLGGPAGAAIGAAGAQITVDQVSKLFPAAATSDVTTGTDGTITINPKTEGNTTGP